jgi:hypothetical protein
VLSFTTLTASGTGGSTNSSNISEKMDDTCVLSLLGRPSAVDELCDLSVGSAWGLVATSGNDYDHGYEVSCGAFCFNENNGGDVYREDFSLDRATDYNAPNEVLMWKTSRGFCRLSGVGASTGGCTIEKVQILYVKGTFWKLISEDAVYQTSNPRGGVCTATCESFPIVAA